MQNGDENVQLLKIDTSEAYEKFSGKYLDSADVGRFWSQALFKLQFASKVDLVKTCKSLKVQDLQFLWG